MRTTTEYWISIVGDAIRKSRTDAIGSWSTVVKEGFVFLVAVAAAWWLLPFKEIANDAVAWSVLVLIGIVSVFVVLLLWNMISLPAKREKELTDRIEYLEPDELSQISKVQWLILGACKPGGPTDEHWLTCHPIQIDGSVVLDEAGRPYYHNYIKSQLQDLEYAGVVRIMYDSSDGNTTSFRLAPALCNLLNSQTSRDKLGITQAISDCSASAPSSQAEISYQRD